MPKVAICTDRYGLYFLTEVVKGREEDVPYLIATIPGVELQAIVDMKSATFKKFTRDEARFLKDQEIVGRLVKEATETGRQIRE